VNIPELIQNRDPILFPVAGLFGLSILTLTTIIERFWFWGSLLLKEDEIVKQVLQAARQRDWGAAAEISRRATALPIGRFLNEPLKRDNPEPELFRLALESTADEELAFMRRGDKILESVTTLAPLLGLLGTVMGLMRSLSSIRIGSLATSSMDGVSKGIGESLESTALGMGIAIVSLASYRLFQGLSSNQVRIFQRAGNELELLYREAWSSREVRSSRPASTTPDPFGDR
jgi:biopolymer transport protein ExbB